MNYVACIHREGAERDLQTLHVLKADEKSHQYLRGDWMRVDWRGEGIGCRDGCRDVGRSRKEQEKLRIASAGGGAQQTHRPLRYRKKQKITEK